MPLLYPTPVDISEAARALGKRGGRPPGSFSSPLAIWLREEIFLKRRERYTRRESFEILRNAEDEDGADAFFVTDPTADEYEIEPGRRVSWDYFKKIWIRTPD